MGPPIESRYPDRMPADVTDIHIHVQPWRQLKPGILDAMRRGKTPEAFDRLMAIMDSPAELLKYMDACGIERTALINYPSPDIMGFGDETNDYVLDYVKAAPDRLLPVCGVHPRFSKDPAGDVGRLADLGMRFLKIHPPHQGFAANAYTTGLAALGEIYRACMEREIPVMIHSGTSIFPGARSKYGAPIDADDIPIDFPDLTVILAHGGRPLWMEEAFFLMRRHRNVWMDISGIPPGKLLDYFPRIDEIADRVLWGTDWPSPGVRDMKENLDAFLALPLADDVKRKITVENARRLFP